MSMETSKVFFYGFEPSGLTPRMIASNPRHSILKRISTRDFIFDTGYSPATVMSARTIRLYCDYNAAVIYGDDLPDREPTFYNPFAKAMNKYDHSGFKWAYIEDGLLVFDDTGSAASADEFCVLDSETTDRYLASDQVAVSRDYFENAERLRRQADRREAKYARQALEKKNATAEGLVNLDSPQAREALSTKRKALEDAAAAEASKKQKGNDGTPVEPPSSPSGSAGGNPTEDTNME
ncbi:hypothetical protein C8F04DRAFT_1108351 [Mycena alexandri]|uniref:Uncharacterized protein n=1 Tax=Mycena alexandri TaxID=1745969 RepID=A0AAD6SQ82_9AGAR|nr:hypothetical protein C8F04DRAFT_1108339 [Mycena alexandri]KAJ7032072.1 hypothetical protein C8F04DRAFT_1108351 [Mycena alexandri]